MTKTKFIKAMRDIRKDLRNSDLRRKVASMLAYQIEGYDKAEDMFQDLSHGCSSGVVGDLIYYADTHKFAKEHIEDILELYDNKQEDLGEIKMEGDKLNWLAWFGFEETAFDIGYELGLEW